MTPPIEPVTLADVFAACCGEGHSNQGDELVLCDGCDKGHHQLCHQPQVTTQDLARDKWFCSVCALKRREANPKIDLDLTVGGEGLSQGNKEDWLASLSSYTLIEYILNLESRFAPQLGLTSLPIWPLDLASQIEKKRIEEIERRRIEAIELAELIALEKRSLEVALAEEDRAKAAATLNDLARNLATPSGGGGTTVPVVGVTGFEDPFTQGLFNSIENGGNGVGPGPGGGGILTPHQQQQQHFLQMQELNAQTARVETTTSASLLGGTGSGLGGGGGNGETNFNSFNFHHQGPDVGVGPTEGGAGGGGGVRTGEDLTAHEFESILRGMSEPGGEM